MQNLPNRYEYNMITEQVASYLALLVAEMRKDVVVLDNPWVVWTFVPFMLYALYMVVKWYLLLAPLTIPLTLLLQKGRKLDVAWLKGKN
jgi:hypothetical protein